jgi:hypothetical protein
MIKLQIGDKVRLNEDTLRNTLLSDVDYYIVNIIDDTLRYNIVLDIGTPNGRNIEYEYFNKNEIIK